MNPVAAAVSRPYTVAVCVILALLASYQAAQQIPVQLKPTVDTPQVTVQTTYRGASATEVEEQVTRELEDVLQSVEGLVEMTSDSYAGRSAITLEFDLETDAKIAVIDVVNKLTRVPSLPEEADEPQVEVASSDEQQPVMWVAVQSRYDPNRVRRIVDDEIEPRLKRTVGVSSLLVVGGAEREIQIRVDPEQLLAREVDPEDLARAITQGNLNVRGGTVETETRQFVVRTVGKPLEAAGLEDLVLRRTEAGVVRLGEIATIRDSYEETTNFVSISGQPGVAMGVRRQVGANVVALIADVDEAIDALNRDFDNRGLDVQLKPVYRETTYIEAAMGFVTGNLVMGALLAVIVLLVFLRSPRSVVVVALSIPISMLGVFVFLLVAGRSLNVISLAGIAFASGMVVDNAIVVLENVFRHLEMGKGAKQAAIDGGLEMWGGVVASTLTTVAVFAPILFQLDEAGQLFKDMAITISSAVALSLVVALTVVPVLAHLFFRSQAAQDELQRARERNAQRGPNRIGQGYAAFTTWLRTQDADRTRAKLGFGLLVLAFSLWTLRLAPPAEYLPTGNRNLVMFFASPIPGTRPESIQRNFKPLERFLLSQPEADRTFAVISPRFNGGGVVLKDEFGTGEILTEFHQRLYGPTSQLAGFRYVVPVRASLFQDPGKQFEVEISGPDFARLEWAAQQLQGRLQEVDGVEFVRSSLVTGNPELQIVLDEDRAKRLGLDVAYVGRVVELVVAGRRLTTLVDGGREVDVNVLSPQVRISSPEDLEALSFLTPDGRQVALSSVASVVRTTGPEGIRHLERQRNVLLTVNIGAGAPLEQVVETVEGEVFPALAAELGPAYQLRVGGSADKLRTTLTALSSGFGYSVLLVYLLLVALFRSWVAPLVILVTVPLALSGGLLGVRVISELYPHQASFDVIAMLGFVILAGLVVNNAILIVHQANNFEGEGMEPREALAESARTRLRPISMSVITTVAGMLPLALGTGAGAELYQGLGAVIVGGLMVSTLFTLFLVPVLLSLGHDAVQAWTGRKRAPQPPQEAPAAS